MGESTRTVGRAPALLAVVCRRGSVTPTAASRDAASAPSTALRPLRTLEGSRFVRRDPEGTFRPGPPMATRQEVAG